MRRMKHLRALPTAAALCLTALLALAPLASQAALAVGAPAPDFTAEAAVGGKVFQFSMAQARQQGPVVLYFYPKSFTSGCTAEAHAFSEATERFKALGATVIGMSNDDLDTQKRFSIEACRGKFPVAADAGAKVMKLYDASLMLMPSMADRITYVVSPQGKVLLSFVRLSADGHVDAALKAVTQWNAEQRR
jgi:thioredoxin-dependent peroxiredoxin